MGEQILSLLEKWHQDGEYTKIIDAIEALPPGEMNDELCGLLARAYNNEGEYGKAIELLDLIVEEKRTELWWYRKGYALYHLEQYAEAEQAFLEVLQRNPEDEDAGAFVEDCRQMLLRKEGEVPFTNRVKKFWESFTREEGRLRQCIDDKDRMEESVDLMAGLLDSAFHEVYFELGHNGEKYQLILTAEGAKHRLFPLNYWKNQAPAELLDRWDFLVGRQRAAAIHQWSLQMFGLNIRADDVTVYPERTEDGLIGLRLYSPVLLPLLDDEEEGENKAYSLIHVLLDQTLGELRVINAVAYVELLREPEEDNAISLVELNEFVEENCQINLDNPCESFIGYQFTPRDEDWQLREDVIVGSTCCAPVVSQYYGGERRIFNEQLQDGVVFGFLYYGNDEIPRGEIVNHRAEIEEQLMEDGRPYCDIIGGATGTDFSYIDCVCYDKEGFLQLARTVLNSREELKQMGFCEFFMEGETVDLKEYQPEYYEEEEMDAVESHIDECFGEVSNVFHELVSPDIHVDIMIVEPNEKRDYYLLCTMGMGAHKMNVPEELRNYGLDRAEVFIALPEEWKLESSDERDYWPLRWLKILARLPIQQDTWLGWGHTVPNGEPFADNTEMSGVMLVSATAFGEDACECTLPNGECVNFYQVIPIYEEEMEYKLEYGAEALLDLFEQEEMDAVLDIHRPNACGD